MLSMLKNMKRYTNIDTIVLMPVELQLTDNHYQSGANPYYKSKLGSRSIKCQFKDQDIHDISILEERKIDEKCSLDKGESETNLF